MGSGDFVGHMLKNDLIPPPSFHLYPLGDDGSSVVYPEERDILPAVLHLDYEVTLYSIRLGLLASEFRSDPSFEKLDVRQKVMAVKLRQSRVLDIQESLRHLWTNPAIQDLGKMQLPIRAQRLFHHAWTTFRACIIYSHTSMWSGQRIDTSPENDAEIIAAVQTILHVSQSVVKSQPTGSRFLVFPLFMAGFASTVGQQKLHVLEIIRQIEKENIGHNATATRRALEAVYEQQDQRFLNTGHSLDVDWLQIMVEQGLTVVNFGL